MLADTLKEAGVLASRSGGMNVMVTGANRCVLLHSVWVCGNRTSPHSSNLHSGIGFHLTKRLAQQGVHVIMGCRSSKRGKEAVAAIKKEVPSASLQLCVVDVSNPVSVREAAASLRRT